MRKNSKSVHWILVVLPLFVVIAELMFYSPPARGGIAWLENFLIDKGLFEPKLIPTTASCTRVLARARFLSKSAITYDPAYRRITYPGGDVPIATGVCTDMVIRSLRTVGMDLQRLVHEDMSKNFSLYPRNWSLSKPDSNIDHRRVPNLMVYFTRHSKALALSETAKDYAPCDVVAWNLGGGITHIGLVSERATRKGRPLIIHHIGGYPAEEDVLFDWKIIGHYRLAELSQ